MTREEFITAIEARGGKEYPENTSDFPHERYGLVIKHEFNPIVATCFEHTATLSCKGVATFRNIPYSAITVELINAVAGKEQNDALLEIIGSVRNE